MKAPRFKYVRAESLEQALRLLDDHGEDARILAGGQSLMPTLNMRLSQPELLIDINRLDGLSGITMNGGIEIIGGAVKAPRFKYVRAESLEQALRLLDDHGEDARILAGGQSLMPTLNMRLSQPELLIDINRLDGLSGITIEDGIVRIGALTRHVEVMNSPVIAEHVPLIAEAMPHVAHVAVRNRGTFGGRVALADPAAEMPACALALGASFAIVRRRGRN